MATNTPDVRIRLSAEGVKEVVDALKQVQATARTAANSTAGVSAGVDKTAASVNALHAGVGKLAGAFAAIGGLAYVKHLNDTNVALARLSQMTGISVEGLSKLTYTFAQSGVDTEKATGALLQLSEKLSDAAAGSGEAADIFRAMGISVRDGAGKMKGLDTILGEIADKFAGYNDGVNKSAIATKLLGDVGAELIPTFNQGSAGIAKFGEEAAKTGGLIKTEATEEAVKFNKSLIQLQTSLTAVARVISGPVIEWVNKLIERFKEARGAGADFGDSLSSAFNVTGFANNIKEAEQEVARLQGLASGKTNNRTWNIGAWFDSARYSADLAHAEENLARLRKAAEGTASALAMVPATAPAAPPAMPGALPPASSLGDKRPNLTLPPPPSLGSLPLPPPPMAPGGMGSVTGKTDAPVIGEADRRAALNKAMLEKDAADAQLRLQQLQLTNQKELAEQGHFYELSQTSLDGYYDKRKEAIISENALEQDVAQKALEVAQATQAVTDLDKVAKDQAVAQAQAGVEQKAMEGKLKLQQLEYDQLNATKELRQELTGVEREQLEQSGDLYKAEMSALGEEVNKYRELLTKLGVKSDEITAKTEEMLAKGTAKANFNELQRQYEDKNTEFDSKRAGIDRSVQVGQTWGFDADTKKMELDKQRLATLKQLTEQMAKEAEITGNRDMLNQVKVYQEAIKDLEMSTNEYGLAIGKLQNAFETSLSSGLNGFFDNIISGSMSAKDAFRGFAAGVVDGVRKVAQELMVQQALKSFFGAFGGGGGMAGGLSSLMGGMAGYAEGGHIAGPGTGTSDSIPAWLSNGEFVVRAAAVKQPGVLDALHQLNSGGRMPALRSHSQTNVARFADGGLVSSLAQASSGGGTSRLEVGLEDGLVLKALESNAGQVAVVKALGNKRRAARQLGF